MENRPRVRMSGGMFGPFPFPFPEIGNSDDSDDFDDFDDDDLDDIDDINGSDLPY